MQGLLVDVLGLDPTIARIVQLVLAFAVVVAAIVLGLWGFSRLTRRMRGGDEDGPSRLRVADVVPIDEKRRLILIRRDDVEHLVLVGGPSDIVVESGIRRGPPARPGAAAPAPRPAAEAYAPEPPRPAAVHREDYAPVARAEPSLDEPVVEPAPAEAYSTPRREPPPIEQVRPPTRG